MKENTTILLQGIGLILFILFVLVPGLCGAFDPFEDKNGENK